MALPLAALAAPALSAFAGFLVRFLSSWAMMAAAALVVEFLPRLFGLGQGLISWGAGAFAEAAFSAFRSSLSLAGVELPSFGQLLSGLPPGVLWAGSAMRVHKVAGILVSVPLVRLARKVLERVAASAAKTSASALLSGRHK